MFFFVYSFQLQKHKSIELSIDLGNLIFYLKFQLVNFFSNIKQSMTNFPFYLTTIKNNCAKADYNHLFLYFLHN